MVSLPCLLSRMMSAAMRVAPIGSKIWNACTAAYASVQTMPELLSTTIAPRADERTGDAEGISSREATAVDVPRVGDDTRVCMRGKESQRFLAERNAKLREREKGNSP